VAREIVFNDKKARAFIKQISKNVKTITALEKAWVKTISPRIFRDVMDHFNKEAGENTKWKPWSKSYQKHMQKLGKGGNKKLQDSGRLRNSFKPTNVKKDKSSLIWFNDAQTKGGFPYAAAHDIGGSRLPQREFMWLSSKAFQDVSKITAKFYTRGLK